MSDPLLSYFEKELHFIRDEAAIFSAQHPGAARALGIRKHNIDDPQVTRLIESIALLNARLQQRLDDTFPDFTQGLLSLLFPHFLRSIPSFSLINFAMTKEASAKHAIPSGTEFDIKDEKGNRGIFRTTKSIDLLPIFISCVDIAFAPFEQAKPLGAEKAIAMIELTIKTLDKGMDLATLHLDQLTLQLNGESNFTLRLYDIFALKTSQVCLVSNGKIHELGKESLQVSGFEEDDFLLPCEGKSFGGFKLLTEFFMFSERFNRFSIDLSSVSQCIEKNEFKLQFFVDELGVDLARALEVSHFSLFSAPLINLHQVTSEPIKIDFHKTQYPLILDANQGCNFNFFCIDDVLDVTENETLNVPQIYVETFDGTKTGLRWQLIQNQDENLSSHLKVVDLNHVSADLKPRIWLVKTTVSDHFKGRPLPITSDITCRQLLTIPAAMHLLCRPSLPVSCSDPDRNIWALFSHLHFNYHAILEAKDPCEALRNLFNIYNHNEGSRNRAYIDAVKKIEQESVVSPIRVSGQNCFAYGTKMTVTLSSDLLQGGVALFSHFLDRFFAYFAGFNSFMQLNIYLEGQDAVLLSFPRRMGCKHH